MIPRRPPMPRLTTNDSASSRASFAHTANATGNLHNFPVIVQSPEGLPTIVEQSEKTYTELFEELLSESLDASLPGFTEAVASLVRWIEHEEAAKVSAMERLMSSYEKLKGDNKQLASDLAEALDVQPNAPAPSREANNDDSRNDEIHRLKETVFQLKTERDESLAAATQLMEDLDAKISENNELLGKIKKLKQVNSELGQVRQQSETNPSLLPPPEEFVRTSNFDEEGRQVVKLLQADVSYVNQGQETLVGWTDIFQSAVNAQVPKFHDDTLAIANEDDLWAHNRKLYYSGFSVLHIAVLMGFGDVVKGWLARGVPPTVTDARGNTVVHLCLMADTLREAGIGFSDSEESSMLQTICDWLKEKHDLNSLLALMCMRNASDLSLQTYEQQGGGSGVPAMSFFTEVVEHILSLYPLGIYHAIIPQPTDNPNVVMRILRRLGITVRAGSLQSSTNRSLPTFTTGANPNRNFQLLTSLDQKKDNMLSWRLMTPTYRFGDESPITYSMLGCDQLRYSECSDYVSFTVATTGVPFDARMVFSTIGYRICALPFVERQTAHIAIMGSHLFVYSQPSGLSDGRALQARPIPLADITKFSLKDLCLLNLLTGYESTTLLRFASNSKRDRFIDVVLETKYKPHLILALCMHYYSFCKPVFPSISVNPVCASVEAKAPPLQVDLNYHNVVPLYNDQETPAAALIQTRFPHSNLLGEVMVVSTRLCVTNSRFLKPFKKLGTVYYLQEFVDWVKTPFNPDDVQTAMCILYADNTLELYSSPVDDASNCLYRITIQPDTGPITPVALDSNCTSDSRGANNSPGFFSTIGKYLDLTNDRGKIWYAIKFQEDPNDTASTSVAVALEIKEERDDWMCLFFAH